MTIPKHTAAWAATTSLTSGEGRARAGDSSLPAVLGNTLTHAKEHAQFGRASAVGQLVQELLADMAVETDALRFLVWRTADLIDRGKPFATAASMVKRCTGETAVCVATTPCSSSTATASSTNTCLGNTCATPAAPSCKRTPVRFNNSSSAMRAPASALSPSR